MKVQITVDEMLWRKARVAALGSGETMGEFVERSIEQMIGGGLRSGGTYGDAQRGGSTPRSKTVKLAAETVKAYSETNSESKNPAPSPTPSTPVPAPAKECVDEEVKMAKCKRCYESFPVADMVTEPKTGKLFCSDCVELMKVGQA